MARAARTSGPSMGPLHVQLYTERLPTLLRPLRHATLRRAEKPRSHLDLACKKSGEIRRRLLDMLRFAGRITYAAQLIGLMPDVLRHARPGRLQRGRDGALH